MRAHISVDLDLFGSFEAPPRRAYVDGVVVYAGKLWLLFRCTVEVGVHDGAEGILEAGRPLAPAEKGLVILRPEEHHVVGADCDAPGGQRRAGLVRPLDSAYRCLHHGPLDAGLFQYPSHLFGSQPGSARPGPRASEVIPHAVHGRTQNGLTGDAQQLERRGGAIGSVESLKIVGQFYVGHLQVFGEPRPPRTGAANQSIVSGWDSRHWFFPVWRLSVFDHCAKFAPGSCSALMELGGHSGWVRDWLKTGGASVRLEVHTQSLPSGIGNVESKSNSSASAISGKTLV